MAEPVQHGAGTSALWASRSLSETWEVGPAYPTPSRLEYTQPGLAPRPFSAPPHPLVCMYPQLYPTLQNLHSNDLLFSGSAGTSHLHPRCSKSPFKMYSECLSPSSFPRPSPSHPQAASYSLPWAQLTVPESLSCIPETCRSGISSS